MRGDFANKQGNETSDKKKDEILYEIPYRRFAAQDILRKVPMTL